MIFKSFLFLALLAQSLGSSVERSRHEHHHQSILASNGKRNGLRRSRHLVEKYHTLEKESAGTMHDYKAAARDHEVMEKEAKDSQSKKTHEADGAKERSHPAEVDYLTGVHQVEVMVTNLSYRQTLGNFFVMVHNEKVKPLFTLGEKASPELQALAENGNTEPLLDHYDGQTGVGVAGTIERELLGGETFYFTLEMSDEYPLITFASMALNTNDW